MSQALDTPRCREVTPGTFPGWLLLASRPPPLDPRPSLLGLRLLPRVLPEAPAGCDLGPFLGRAVVKLCAEPAGRRRPQIRAKRLVEDPGELLGVPATV